MGARSGLPEASHALEQLCRIYRPAVLGYVRKHGYHSAEAEDLTQAFFERLLSQRTDATADPARGRFRVFIQVAVRRFLLNQRVYNDAAKRGGGHLTLSLEATAQIGHEPADADTPESAFDRAWASALVRAAVSRLQAEAAEVGKQALFRTLQPFLLEPPEPDEYAKLAAALAMRRNTVAVAIHRLRQRLRELVRDELAETVADAEALDAELAALHGVLALPKQGASMVG